MRWAVGALAAVTHLCGQIYDVSTVAGRAKTGTADGLSDNARFYAPEGIVVTANGDAFVSDTRNHTIRRIARDGSVSTFAGAAGLPGMTDGASNIARFRFPAGLALDTRGNLLLADRGNHVIRQITPDGVVSTLVGLAGVAGNVNGPASIARLNSPTGVVQRRDGALAIIDLGNRTIRLATTDGVVSTLAGTAGVTGYANGNGAGARFADMHSIVADPGGDLFVTDSYDTSSRFTPVLTNSIRRITPSGAVSDLVVWLPFSSSPSYRPRAIAINAVGKIMFGSGDQLVEMARDGSGLTVIRESAQTGPLGFVSGIATDAAGAIFAVDPATHSVRKIVAGGTGRTIGGGVADGPARDGIAAEARFNQPRGLAADAAGNVFVADSQNHTIRRIGRDGAVTTVAGAAGLPGNQDGTGREARFSRPSGVAFDRNGFIYVADTGNSLIRRIDLDGVVSTLAGATTRGFVDATGSDARFAGPEALAVNAAGEVFVADTANDAVRRITPAGVVSTFYAPTSFDDALRDPRDIAVDAQGNLYVVHAYPEVLKISPARMVTKIPFRPAGSAPGSPRGIAVDPAGNLFTTTATGIVIVEPGGRVSPLAGDTFGAGSLSFFPQVIAAPPGSTLGRYVAPGSTDGAGFAARFSAPTALVVSPQGELFCSDTGNHTVRKAVVATNPPRLTNASILKQLASGGDGVTVGAKLGGTGTSGEKSLLVRAAGTSLRRFGIDLPLADPRLESFDGSLPAGMNDDWGGASALRETFARLGAFPFDAGESREAALLQTFRQGTMGVRVGGNGQGGGTTLVELYDADEPGFAPTRPRLTNASVLCRIDSELNVGFLVAGTGVKSLLIRAVGPTLRTTFGIVDELDDPQLEVFDAAGRIVARNERWSSAAHSLVMLDAFQQVGAFGLLGDSLEAVAFVTLEPGAYIIRVRPGIGRQSGVGLVELYEFP